ncbi:hypothetical protein LguiA_027909 [Lonicera macranthoides]
MSTMTKSASSCSDEDLVDDELRRGPWTVEEDTLLIHYIHCHGEGRWNLLAKRSGLKRSGKSCRLRWLNYLKPDVKRGNLSPQEQLLILELHFKWGNRWSKIAQHLPGRTDNEIKNYWRTRVQKQARHLKIDSNSTAFKEVIRCLWMPHLLQKIHGSAPLDPHFKNSLGTLPLNESPPPPPLQVPLDSSRINHQKNSSSDNCTSPSICSSDQSMNFSQFPTNITDYLTNPFSGMDNSYDMGTFCLDAASSVMGEFVEPMGDRHVMENNWIGDDEVADSLWNMDELWQLQQRGNRLEY